MTLQRTRTNNPKMYMEPQKTQNFQRNPEEKEQRRYQLPQTSDNTHHYDNQNSKYWPQNRRMDQCNTTEHPEINPNI